MSEFKGTRGKVYLSENKSAILTENNSLIVRVFDGKGNALLEHKKQSQKIVETNANLIIDAFNVRQQINCELPELLEQKNEMLGMLELLITKKRNMVHPALCVEIEQLISKITE